MTTTTITEQPSLFAEMPPLPTPVTTTCPCCHGRGIVTLDGPIPSAPARDSDPATSHAAAETEPDVRRFSARSRQAALLECIAALPRTAQRAATLVVGETAPVSRIEGCRRRMSDLVRAGLIADSGERQVNPGSDEASIVWRITDAGTEALARLLGTGWST